MVHVSRLWRMLSACGAVLFASVAVQAAPLGSAFTYQGQLKQNGISVNGAADLIFTLWTDAAAGSQVGSTLTFDGAGGNPAPVNVAGGLFQVELDFGAAAFTGDELYLEIQARFPAGSGAYTLLGARQKLTAAPYALYALNSGGGNTLNQAYNQGGPGAGRIITANAGPVQIDGTGGLAVASQLHVVPNLSFVGVNRNTRITSSEHFGVNAPIAGAGLFGGMYINTLGETALPFYGYATAGAARAWHHYDHAVQQWRLYVNNSLRMVVAANGDVGIGDSTPDGRLSVLTTSGDAIVASTNSGHGVVASTTAAFSYGVSGSGTSAGVYGSSGASNGAGVKGENNTTGGTGVRGESSASGSSGVAGYANNGTGVYGQSFNGYGVYGTNGGSNTGSYAGYFNGRVHVAGTLSKTGGTFKIDHPLDPANKTLSHSFVESPDRMNVYNGNVVLNGQGQAVVQLPDWFGALNKDFRYQLTAIGGPGPNLHVAQEIEANSFVIAGGQPGLKVSWQVTGVRKDAWAVANPMAVEEDKPETERGTYLNPEVFGGVSAQAWPELEQ